MKRIFFLSLLVIVSVPLLAQNQTDLGSMKDNTLFEDPEGTVSNGAGPNLFVGKNNLGEIRRGVIAFDVAGTIPPGATIDSVKLTLFMSQTMAATEPVELHKLMANWGEGTSNSLGGQGDPSTTDDATWIHTFYDVSFWTTTGGDFSSTVSAVLAVDAAGFYTWGSAPEMVSDVQDWLDNPSTNYGWLLEGNEIDDQTAKRFDTKENATPANRPVLSIYWTDPTSVEDQPAGELPQRFELGQNYPNPFNPSTTIGYALPQSRYVTLKVYNLIGQEVATLVNGWEPAGQKTVRWNGLDNKGIAVPTGLYVYRLGAGGFVASRRMILLK